MNTSIDKQKLEMHFTSVLENNLLDVPIVNPELRVEACGFRSFQEYSLCVMCTPWFMSLLILPEEQSSDIQWKTGQSFFHCFPSGEYEFTGVYDETLGSYQTCSLFSPMFEFSSHSQAVEVAIAALDQLFVEQPQATPNKVTERPIESENITRRDLFRHAFGGSNHD